MAQPTPYTPATLFADDERTNAGGRSTVRTDRIDAELAALALTLGQMLANLALVQRDDGQIRDNYVELYNLSASCRAALGAVLNPRGTWGAGTAYAKGDLIGSGLVAYVCPVAHTSTVFADDLAAGKWQVFSASANASGIAIAAITGMTSTEVQSGLSEVYLRTRTASAHSYGAL